MNPAFGERLSSRGFGGRIFLLTLIPDPELRPKGKPNAANENISATGAASG